MARLCDGSGRSAPSFDARVCLDGYPPVNPGLRPPPSAADGVDRGIAVQPLGSDGVSASFVPTFASAPDIRGFSPPPTPGSWRYEESRFGAELKALAGWLAEQGHLRHPLRLHLHRVRKVLDGCDRFQSGRMFKEEDLRQVFIVPGRSAYGYICTGRIFIRFLAATGRLAPVQRTDALGLLRLRYHHYLAEVRGLSQQSLKQHGATVADFLSRGLTSDRGLSGLTAADIEAFVQIKSQTNNRQSLQHIIAQMRAFLRYCGDHLEAPSGLDVIDTPRVYRGELLPRALDWTIVRRLLASIWRRSPRDWRDYTVLHLMAYYGLRPSEIAALRLDAVDWQAGTLRVDQRKTRSVLVLPLAARTLCLLRRYLSRDNLDENLRRTG